MQDLLQSAGARRRGSRPGQAPTGAAPLKGKICDETGDLLTPTHTERGGRRHRYYVSNRLVSGGADPAGWRLPAKGLEEAITAKVTEYLRTHCTKLVHPEDIDARSFEALLTAMADLAGKVATTGVVAAAPLVRRIDLRPEHLGIDLDADAVTNAVALPAARLDPDHLTFEAPFSCRRRGAETKILIGDRVPLPDPALIAGLRNAHRWSAKLKSGTPLAKLASDERRSDRYVSRVAHLAGLSPKIQRAILGGTQPIGLTLERLLRDEIPFAWDAQERQFPVT